MSIDNIVSHLRYVKDFPIKGIKFVDVTTILKDPKVFAETVDYLYEMYKDKGITKIAAMESRGYWIGSALAYRLGAGLIPVRKPGKLPAATFKEVYAKEYGQDTIEVHQDAFTPDDIVLIHDDILATGGTMKATIDLVKRFSTKKVYCNTLIELTNLPGRSLIPDDVDYTTMLQIDENKLDI